MANQSVQSGGVAFGLDSTVRKLYEKSGAAELGMECAEFTAILHQVAEKNVALNASHSEISRFCETLHVEELALARACAAGSERAWEIFLLRYREKLYDIGTYVAKESSAGRELADSLYADLYGTTTRDGRRLSKLNSYTGRGSLEGWLRTVMAQEHVNRYRKVRRLVSLEEESEAGVQFAAAHSPSEPAVDSRLESATDEVLAALPAEDRFILAAYYLDGRKLAEIAAMLGVHESTISRKLDKLAKFLRKQVLAKLMKKGMSRRQAEEALQVDVRDLRLKVRETLTQEVRNASFSEKAVVAEHVGEGGKERLGARGAMNKALSTPAKEMSNPEA